MADQRVELPEEWRRKKTGKPDRNLVFIMAMVGIIMVMLIALIFFYGYGLYTGQHSLPQSFSSIINKTGSSSGNGTGPSSTPTSTTEKPHEYRIEISDCTWNQAESSCEEMGGHLVTFETDAEYKKILNLISENGDNNYRFYIGGKRASDSKTYYWINNKGEMTGGSLNGKEYWLDGDPSFYDPNAEGDSVTEDRMMIFYWQNGNKWVWADVPNDVPSAVPSYQGRVGYICEIE